MPQLGPPNPRLPIGVAEYRELWRGGYGYVDKTAFIAHVIDANGESVLLPRPRRFGKTLGMSALRYFLESGTTEDRSELFEDTYIWQADGGRHRQGHFVGPGGGVSDVQGRERADVAEHVARDESVGSG